MGLGQYPCGLGPCGLDPVAQIAAVKRSPLAGLEFDGQTKDFKLDSEGKFIAAHPVDETVYLIVRTAASSIRSATETGNTAVSIKYIDPLKTRAEVKDRLTMALKSLVDDRKIQIREINVTFPARGATQIVLDYTNLLTGKNSRVTQ